MTRPALALSTRQEMVANLRTSSRGAFQTDEADRDDEDRDDEAPAWREGHPDAPNAGGGSEFRQDEAPAAPASAREARAAMIESMRSRSSAKRAGGAGASARADRAAMIGCMQAAPPPATREDGAMVGAVDARAAMVASMKPATGGRRADGIQNAGPYPSKSSEPEGGTNTVRGPDEVVAYWERLSPQHRRIQETRTAEALRQLLVRKGRREFPLVPVLLDGRRLPVGVLDDAWAYLRLELHRMAKPGPGPHFDPLDFLLDAVVRVIAARKRSGTTPAEGPANRWQWEENLREDLREDRRALSIDFRTLAAPLVLTTLRPPQL